MLIVFLCHPHSHRVPLQANMLNGTDGMAFQPELQDVDELYVFSEDLRR